MIAAQPNRPVQERLIAGLMRAPNAVVSQVHLRSFRLIWLLIQLFEFLASISGIV
jgi:hypothetical protein